MLHFGFPVDQERHHGTHQEDRADHSDIAPAGFADGLQHLAGQQEVQAGGDPRSQETAAQIMMFLQQADQGADRVKQDDDCADDLDGYDRVIKDTFDETVNRLIHRTAFLRT